MEADGCGERALHPLVLLARPTAKAGGKSLVQQRGSPRVKNTLWYPGSVKPMAVTSEAFRHFFQSTVIGGAVVTNQTLSPLSAV